MMSITINLLIVVMAAVNIEADESCAGKLDLALMLDGSSSVCDYGPGPCPKWTAMLEFCKRIVNSLNIGRNETRVAFVTFSNRTNVEWNLLRYTDKTPLAEAIGNVKLPGGEFTDIATVPEIITKIFNLANGDRVGVQNIGILVSDGAPKNIDEVYGTLSEGVQADDVAAFVVCKRPGCTEHFASSIASPPKTVDETYFFIDDYLKIDKVRDPLVKKFCDYKTEEAELWSIEWRGGTDFHLSSLMCDVDSSNKRS